MTSSGVSRSNTFNTVSSGGSGTLRSREKSPDPKGFQSPRRVLSQKSARTFDSLDKDLSTSNNININNHQQTSQQPKNDWMMMNEVSKLNECNDGSELTQSLCFSQIILFLLRLIRHLLFIP